MVNKNGFLVNIRWQSPKTYAATDRASLDRLIQHLTGNAAAIYPTDERGLPKIRGVLIAEGLHIYSCGA